MRLFILAVLASLAFASTASAQSAWQQISTAGDLVGGTDVSTAEPGKTYQTTIGTSPTTTESKSIYVARCSSWTVEANSVFGTATIQRCFADSACIDAFPADLTDGDFGYTALSATALVKIVNATSGDVLSLTCGG